MVFGAESATGVPRRQRAIFGFVHRDAFKWPWARGRALRGFLTTAGLALLVWCAPRVAHAQATARFADAPAEPVPPSAPPPSAAPLPAPPPSAAPARAAATPAGTPEPVLTAGDKPLASASAPGSALATSEGGFTRRLAQSHLERAELLERRGDIAQALREYTECIGIDSTLGDAYLELGALRERMGEPREADLVYSVAARLTDTRSRALLQRSHLRRAAGLGPQALTDLESAVELDASSPLLQELARDYVELHAWSAALAVFRRIARSATEAGDTTTLETARLEVRALRVLAAEADPSQEQPAKHDWIGRALRSIARR